jgi:hypothetical protein
MATYTKAGLFQYLDIALDKGHVNGNTGSAWRAAANKLLGDLGDDDSVEGYDLEAAAIRQNNKNPGDLTGQSLKKYVQRSRAAIEQYIAWKSDPMNYKPPSRGLPTDGKATPGKTLLLRRTRPVAPPAAEAKVAHAETGQYSLTGHPPTVVIGKAATPALTIPFPLRREFVATIVIPHDLTVAEATRLSALIQALGHDTTAPAQETSPEKANG